MIAKRIEKLTPSGIREFFDLVLGMPDVISLGVGEPDFITPWRIREKAITALEDGLTSYTSNKGLFVLRRDICHYLEKKYSLKYDPQEEIVITVGVSEGLDLALRAVLEPHDKVIVVSPHYVAYPALVDINQGRPLYLTTKEENNFNLNPQELKVLLKKNPKAIILNYPSNPTGVTYNLKDLRRIWKVLSSQEAIVISDEIYGELTYEQEHIPFASLDRRAKKRTILLGGFSKGYAMTGFRVGFACAERKIISAMTKIHSYSALCAPIISQLAGLEALRAQKEVSQMNQEYKQRGDFIVKELARLGLTAARPQGAFYCFPSLKKFRIDSLQFARRLLFEEKVAVVPGGVFGKSYQSYIRISYANSLDNLKEAVIRIERFLKTQVKRNIDRRK